VESVTDKSIRWLPQKDDSTNASVQFTTIDGSQLLDATLTIQGISATTNLAGASSPYSVTWKANARCPKDSQGVETCLPAGDYSFSLTATTADKKVIGPLQGTISLVEVTSVDIQQVQAQCTNPNDPMSCVPAGPGIDNNPSVDLCCDPTNPEEPASNRVARPGGGLRVFAEAPDAGLPPLDIVNVVITTTPKVPVAVPVSLVLKDVDDPDGSPIDIDGDDPSKEPADNYGVGSIAESVTIPANAITTTTPLVLSHNPGDNYRVLASTSSDWLSLLKAHQPSQTGEVWDNRGNPLPEGGIMSKMITVWRTLHLEIDSMKRAPADTATTDPERNFIDGRVTKIEGHVDHAVRVFLAPDSPPPSGMNQLRDASNDLSGVPGVDHGQGRFEHGTIRFGQSGNAVQDMLDGNGIDYVERDFITLTYRLVGLDGTELSVGSVISGEPEKGHFLISELKGSLATAQNDAALLLEIGDVSYNVLNGGIMPTQLVDGVLVNEVLVRGRPLRFHLVDDDAATAPFIVNTDFLHFSSSSHDNAFAAAYIRPVFLSVADNKQAPFKRNIECPEIDAVTCDTTDIRNSLAQGRDTPQPGPLSAFYWVSYIQGAFQPGTAVDRDPDAEANVAEGGNTVGFSGRFGSLVYVEPLREQAGGNPREFCWQTTVPHEIGHQFGIPDDRDAGGIMSQGCLDTGRFFAAQSLADIRKNGVLP
jgi:hypothetical protein